MAAEYRPGLMPQKSMRRPGAITSGNVLPRAAAISAGVGFQGAPRLLVAILESDRSLSCGAGRMSEGGPHSLAHESDSVENACTAESARWLLYPPWLRR